MNPDINKSQLLSIIRTLKRQKGVKNSELNEVRKLPEIDCAVDDINNILKERGHVRKMASKNTMASFTIIKALREIIPQGGSGILIGTPLPFCASSVSTNNMVLVDELIVAHELNFSTDNVLEIIIGNGNNKERAKMKCQEWKRNNITCNCAVVEDIVDKTSFTSHVTRVVEKSPLTKVVLITSGHYTNSNWNGMDLNFKEACLYLTQKDRYPNLHILAMVFGPGNNFHIKYHNDGKVTDMEIGLF
jgi:hypothetical protein